MGGTGQSFFDPSLGVLPTVDCRYPSDLPNGPYPFISTNYQLNNCPDPIIKPAITPTQFTDNVGDPVHRFFQMWQQNDCSVANMTASNPSGCAHDLYTWVATTVGWQITRGRFGNASPLAGLI